MKTNAKNKEKSINYYSRFRVQKSLES